MIIQIGTDVDESRILWKYKESDEWKRADIDDLIRAYKNKPTERTGKWIVERYCSECEWDKHEAELVCNIPTNYCPNCGAKMRGEEE